MINVADPFSPTCIGAILLEAMKAKVAYSIALNLVHYIDIPNEAL